METEKSKSWYLSKTIWGSLVAVVVGTLIMFGVTGAEGEESAITDVIMQIVGVVGAVFALYGRIVAKKNIVPFLLIGVMLLGLAGCSDPLLTAEQKYHLLEATAEVNLLNERCQDGDMEACKDGLNAAAAYLNSLGGE